MFNQIGTRYFKPPTNLTNYLVLLLPIIISQILQRLYPMIDTRFLSVLGQNPLYIHSIQYTFVSIGQFIGAATATSCFVFWNRAESKGKQGGIFINHLVLVSLFSFIIMVILLFLAKYMLHIYSVSPLYMEDAIIYFRIGLLNMFLQAIYCTIDGMLIASNQRKFSMIISLITVLLNIIVDYVIAYNIFNGHQSPSNIKIPLILFGFSTSIILIFAIFISSIRVIKQIDGWINTRYKQILHVWSGEIGVAIISSLVPLIYAYQMKFIHTTQSFLIMYQMVSHLSYIFCLPFLSALKVAVTEASRDYSSKHNKSEKNEWWPVLLYTGLIPTYILFALGCLYPIWIIQITFHYKIPFDQTIFIILFYLSCMIGQIGNAISVPIRAAKQSKIISRNFFWSEIIIMLGCMQLAILLNIATPLSAGVITLIFASSYTIMNLKYLNSISYPGEIKYETAN